MKFTGIFIFIFFCCATPLGSLEQALSKIPKNERQQIETLFKTLIYRSGFGYTLWGLKPMSVEIWPIGFIPAYLPFDKDLGYVMKEAFEVWKKYQNFFSLKKFIFADRFLESPDGIFYYEIYLIHKECCDEIYKQYSGHFSKLASPEKILCDAKLDHESLGLLFGYGKHNSHLFKLKQRQTEGISQLPFTLKKIPKAFRKKAEEIGNFDQKKRTAEHVKIKLRTLLREHALFNSSSWIPLSCYKNKNPLTPMRLPACMVDSQAEETKELYKEYSDCRKKIIQRLKSGNFLENVLKKLCEDS